VVGVCQNLVGFDQFSLLVAGVDGFAVGARCGHDLAAIDGEWLKDEGAVSGERIGAMLPLHECRRAGGLGRV